MPEPTRFVRPVGDVEKLSESAKSLQAMRRQIEQQLAAAQAAEAARQAAVMQAAAKATAPKK